MCLCFADELCIHGPAPWNWGLSFGCPVLFNPGLQTSWQQQGCLFPFAQGASLLCRIMVLLKITRFVEVKKKDTNSGLFYILLSASGESVNAGACEPLLDRPAYLAGR